MTSGLWIKKAIDCKCIKIKYDVIKMLAYNSSERDASFSLKFSVKTQPLYYIYKVLPTKGLLGSFKHATVLSNFTRMFIIIIGLLRLLDMHSGGRWIADVVHCLYYCSSNCNCNLL